MQSDELVRLVMDRLGAASADQLAERMGWRFNQVRTVNLWLAGTSQPSYPFLMAMLEAAGLLRLDAPASSPVAAVPVDSVAAARALDEAASVLQRLADDLRGRADPRVNAN